MLNEKVRYSDLFRISDFVLRIFIEKRYIGAMKKNQTIAERLGETFAVLQHGTDLIAEWGIKKLREVEKTNPPKNLKSAGGKAMMWTRNAMSFFGTVGDVYYEKYEEAKRKKNKK